ncbi:MAG: LamG-like jellyroll fold domain-containing protein [Planctomycetaceae bacterium]
MMKKGMFSRAVAVSICLVGLGRHCLANELGLVGHWRFDGRQGNLAKDSSGNGNHGTIHKATWTEGKVGAALRFNGKDTYVDCGNDRSLNLPKAFTIEAWVRQQQGGQAEQSIVGKGSKYNANYLLKLGIPWVENRLMLKVSDQRTQGIEIEYDRWHHVVGVCDGERIAIFINGTLASERPYFHGLKTNSLPVTIGNVMDASASGKYFSGIIDEVKIYDRVLDKYKLKGPTGPGTSRKTRGLTTSGPWGNYEAFPGLCKLASGDLLVAFYAGTGHMGYPHPSLPKHARICMMRSTDGAKTWTTPETLFDSEAGDCDPRLAQLKDGTVICTFYKQTWYRKGRVCEMAIVRSTDNGKTWSAKPQILPSPWYTEQQKQHVIRMTGPKAVGEPEGMELEAINASCSPVRELANGTLILAIYGYYGKHRASSSSFYGSAVIRSKDQGRTWGDVSIISASSPSDRCEPDLMELNDGRLLCVMRPGMEQSVSADQGDTWTQPRELQPFARGHAPFLVKTRDGTLLCGYREMPLAKTSVLISTNNGKSWSRPLIIDYFGGAYIGMVELDDGRILSIYYGESVGIRQAIFNVELEPTPHIRLVE